MRTSSFIVYLFHWTWHGGITGVKERCFYFASNSYRGCWCHSEREASWADKLCQWDANPCSTEEGKKPTELDYCTNTYTHTPRQRTTLKPNFLLQTLQTCMHLLRRCIVKMSFFLISHLVIHTPLVSAAAHRAVSGNPVHKLNQANHPHKIQSLCKQVFHVQLYSITEELNSKTLNLHFGFGMYFNRKFSEDSAVLQ